MTHQFNLLERPPFPDRFDSTILSTLDSCERKWFYEYLHHLSASATSPDLHAGGAFAKGIEAVRHDLWVNKAPLDDALVTGANAFTAFWGDYEPPENHPKTYVNTLGALMDYFREYPPEHDPVTPYVNADGTPAIEFSFAIPMDIKHPDSGDPIIYCGRFDLLGYYGDNDLYIIDEKTTKSLGARWVDQWDMRGQFMGYCFAAQTYGFPAAHACVRGISILKTKYGHLQALIFFPQWQIERWWQQAHRKVRRALDAWRAYDFDYSYADACSSYGGCQYKSLCTSAPDKIDNWLGEFKYRKWDPLAVDPTESREQASVESTGKWDF